MVDPERKVDDFPSRNGVRSSVNSSCGAPSTFRRAVNAPVAVGQVSDGEAGCVPRSLRHPGMQTDDDRGDGDWSVEVAMVRAALGSAEFADRASRFDALLALMLRATAGDRRQWQR